MSAPNPAPVRPPTPEEIRSVRQPVPRIIATVLGLVLAWIVAFQTNRFIEGHLAQSLYNPACDVSCSAVRGKTTNYRRGGRGNTGQIQCWCNGPAPSDWQWARADLSKGSLGDLALHWGGQEILAVGLFGLIAGLAFFLAQKIPGKNDSTP